MKNENVAKGRIIGLAGPCSPNFADFAAYGPMGAYSQLVEELRNSMGRGSELRLYEQKNLEENERTDE